MRHHYISIRVAKLWNIDTTKGQEGVEQQELSYSTVGSVKMYSHFGRLDHSGWEC